jgi:hypothetical protein
MQTVTDAFIEELRQPVFQMRVRMDVLDSSGDPVDGGTFNDVGFSSDSTAILLDGSVDVDVTRPARRTFTATLLNQFGQWSPSADWSGLFYVDREVKLYRGLVYRDGTDELVPIGTFLIDHADVIVERNMSTVVLSGTDRWKKIAKSLATHTHTWAVNTNINTVITDILTLIGAGVTTSLDTLGSRSALAKELNVKLVVELGDSWGDVLWKLAADYGIDMYFDPDGVFTTQDMQNPDDQAIVYTFVA